MVKVFQNIKDKSKVIDVIGNIKNSPFCKLHLAEITRYTKASKSERWVLDESVKADATPTN